MSAATFIPASPAITDNDKSKAERLFDIPVQKESAQANHDSLKEDAVGAGRERLRASNDPRHQKPSSKPACNPHPGNT